MLYPMFHELWGVSVLVVVMGIIFVPCEDWVLFPLSFLLVHSLRWYPHTDALICWILEKELCRFTDLTVQRTLQISPFWNCILWMLAIQVHLNSQLHPLNSVGQWSPSWIFPFCTTARNFLQVVNWSNHRVHLLCFLSLMDYCPLLPNIQCFETFVLCILSFLLF